MNSALLSGVSGLKAHQKMIDVAGNNLANVNTQGFKSSRITFGDMLGQTIRQATQANESTGGTNPMQVGTGVQVGMVQRDMSAGSIMSTGQALDMAIEGDGYFALNNGTRDVYTRVGAFGVDENFNLVDPNTGYKLQRIGSEGEADGFQSSTSTDIKVPYNTALPARSTEQITFAGNLSSDEYSPTKNLMTSGTQYTKGGTVAGVNTLLVDLDQASAALNGETLTISGAVPDGTAVNTTLAVDGTTTVQDLLDSINGLYGSDAKASLINGEIRLEDAKEGYSRTDLQITSSNADAIELPKYFTILAAGGEAVKNTNIEIFDSQGISHVLSASFVKTDTPNQWDIVMTNITGDVELVDRRVEGVTFLADGSYGGIDGSDPTSFQVRFGHDPANTRTLYLDLGSEGDFNGLSQFGGGSTVAPSGQDGYAPGWLSSLSVSPEGVLVGTFTNGVRRDIAALRLATFQNPGGLESIGKNYYLPTANSGDPVATRGLTGGAGAVRGESLEGSNVDTAGEFVHLIEGQNGFQANARTITISNEMLRELTNLIR
ncbi:MAG: flagellar hook protein FlgE [Phycisphaerae bacterium]